MAVYTTSTLIDNHHTLLAVLADPIRVAGGGAVSPVRLASLLVEAGPEVLLTPVNPPPLDPPGTLVVEPVVVYREGATDPVPMRIDRSTPLGLVRYLLHRVRTLLGIPDSYVDPYEDRF